MNSINKLDGPSYLFHKKPRKLIFLLHGYGDYADNFIPLAEYLNDKFIEGNFFAPNAPFILSQYPLGRQWFNPYPNGIHYNEAGIKEQKIMKQECETSINYLQEYIENLCSVNSLSYQDCFLIGFSQGAMIAYELGNYINKKFAGCVMLSGRILLPKNPANIIFVKTPLLIVHGDNDDIVPSKYYTEACEIAKINKFTFENHLLNNEGHTISSKTLQLVQKFIKKYV
jgi:phospholipase/carboxylesterase